MVTAKHGEWNPESLSIKEMPIVRAGENYFQLYKPDGKLILRRKEKRNY